jgi:hypothetical protein
LVPRSTEATTLGFTLTPSVFCARAPSSYGVYS